jgi:hypothetical protein
MKCWLWHCDYELMSHKVFLPGLGWVKICTRHAKIARQLGYEVVELNIEA